MLHYELCRGQDVKVHNLFWRLLKANIVQVKMLKCCDDIVLGQWVFNLKTDDVDASYCC